MKFIVLFMQIERV